MLFRLWCRCVNVSDDETVIGPLGLITFRVSRRRREMYIGHARLCLSVRGCMPTQSHYCTDSDVTWGNGRGAPSCALLGGFAIGARVVLLWQRSANAQCQRVLVLALCLVDYIEYIVGRTVCKKGSPYAIGPFSVLSSPVLSVTLVYCGQTVGWMDQDETWHGGRPRPRRHCFTWGPSSPKKTPAPHTSSVSLHYLVKCEVS